MEELITLVVRKYHVSAGETGIDQIYLHINHQLTFVN
jgi:hypothetical protein